MIKLFTLLKKELTIFLIGLLGLKPKKGIIFGNQLKIIGLDFIRKILIN